MSAVLDTCRRAAAVKHTIGALRTTEKNRVLLAIADALEAHREDIKAANALDIAAGRENGPEAFERFVEVDAHALLAGKRTDAADRMTDKRLRLVE